MPRAGGIDLPRRQLLLGSLSAAALLAGKHCVFAAEQPLKLGVLTDLSGAVVDFSGPGTITSLKMAIEDFGGKVNGRPIELRTADHFNKPDVGLATARRWYDEGVDAIFDVGMTSIALAVQTLTRERNKTVIFISSSSTDLTGKACSSNGIHWSHNSFSQSVGTIRENLRNGRKSWYFITIDYTFGAASERDATRVIQAAGGRIVGSSRHPWDASDFSSQLLQAQASGADVIALATTTGHAGTIVKQAKEFGILEQQTIAPFSWGLHEVKALGLATAQGLYSSAPFYWDENERSRAFADRYFTRLGRMPNEVQASAYGAMMHYLKAVSTVDPDNGTAVIAKMKETPINDFMTAEGVIRPDGRVMRDVLVFKVKSPTQSKGEWDIFEIVGKVPANEAFLPADPTVCPLAAKS